MATQINPGLARLWIAANTRQYGYRRPHALNELSSEQQRLLDFLEHGVTQAQLQSLNKLANTNKATVSEILSEVSPLLWQSSRTLPKQIIEERFAEITRIFLMGQDPADILLVRKKKIVFIESLDSTGFTIGKALAIGGIGRLISLDQKRVSNADLGPLSYSKSEVGIPRVRAAQKTIGPALEFHSRISRSLDQVSASVVIANDIVNPNSYQKWMARDIPHLSICFDEEGVEISPLILPGKTPCLGCMQLYEIETKENWKLIAPQLLALDRDLGDAPLLLFAAAIATNTLLNFFDSGECQKHAIRLNREGEVITLEPRSISCGCRY
jgi:hypothetical protein